MHLYLHQPSFIEGDGEIFLKIKDRACIRQYREGAIFHHIFIQKDRGGKKKSELQIRRTEKKTPSSYFSIFHFLQDEKIHHLFKRYGRYYVGINSDEIFRLPENNI